jgi:D-alanyl-D-alanine dipeptidase
MNKYLRNLSEVSKVDPVDIWKYYIAREYFTTIPIIDNNEPLVSEKFLLNGGLAIEPIWVGDNLDEEGKAYKEYLVNNVLKGWARQSVADRLLQASKALKLQSFTLVLKAGFRPIEVQQKLFKDVLEGFRLKYPLMSASKLLEMTRDYVSDPSQLSPPHTVGAAVDVMLRDSQGGIVDMGCEVNQGEDIAWADYSELTGQQVINRKILREAMTWAGFAPLGSEWWHFSYGDQIWAAYYSQQIALYDIYSN